jgi:co-chaperonin GroES (HSP10)
MTQKKEKGHFEPLNKWLLVKAESTTQTFGTSFVSADDQVKKPQYGTVIAIGDGVTNVDVTDRLYFQTNGTIEIEVEEEKLLLVNKSNLLGRWKTI